MKGQWESNINVWFPFMYSLKWNGYFQNRIVMFCLPVPTLIYLWERLIYFQDQSAYSAAGKYVDQSWEYINCSQIFDSGNWDWGCAIPRKGIHIWYFRCSASPTLCAWAGCCVSSRSARGRSADALPAPPSADWSSAVSASSQCTENLKLNSQFF